MKLIDHLTEIWGFYTLSKAIEIQSAYCLNESRDRLIGLDKGSELCVRCANNGFRILCRRGARANVIVMFLGDVFENHEGGIALRGTIGLERGARAAVLIISCIVLIYFPLDRAIAGRAPFGGLMTAAVVVLIGLLECGYSMGMADRSKIMRGLHEAIAPRF